MTFHDVHELGNICHVKVLIQFGEADVLGDVLSLSTGSKCKTACSPDSNEYKYFSKFLVFLNVFLQGHFSQFLKLAGLGG